MSTIYYNDILAESLAFGKRRELAMLEATNRRIHSIVDCWLSEAPFLVFDLKYKYRSKTSKFRRILVDPFAEFVPKDNFPCEQELYISGAAVMRQGTACKRERRNRPDEKPFIFAFNANLQTIPRYLRFHFVDLSALHKLKYTNADVTPFLPLLKQLAPAFNGCTLNYESSVDTGARAARKNAAYLDLVSNHILPLAPNTAVYKLGLSFEHGSDSDSEDGIVLSSISVYVPHRSIDSTLASSILRLAPIEHCNHLSLSLNLCSSDDSIQLPIAAIKIWLFRSQPAAGESSGVGSLLLHMNVSGKIENVADLVDAIQSAMLEHFQTHTQMNNSSSTKKL